MKVIAARSDKVIKIFLLAMVAVLLAAALIFSAPAVAEAAPSNEEDYTFQYDNSKNSTVYNGAAQPFQAVTVLYMGAPFEDYTITYTLDDAEPTEDAPVNAGVYAVSITINETEIVRNYTYTILPKLLQIVYNDSTTNYTYDNYVHKINVSAIGAIGGDETGFAVSYIPTETTLAEGELPKNADVYSLEFSLDNPNYTAPAPTKQLVINKRVLTVKVNDVSVVKNETAEFTFTYSNFADGDSDAVLEVRPTVTANTSIPGAIIVTASGGQDENYTFNYLSGVLTVNATEAVGAITDSVTTVSATGVFSPSTNIGGTAVSTESERGKQLIQILKDKGAYYLCKFGPAYSLAVNDSGAILGQKTRISLSNVTIDARYNIKIYIVDAYGVPYEITSYVYKDGTLSFTIPSSRIGDVVVVYDVFGTYQWYIIGGVIAFFVILFLIGSAVGYKNLKHSLKQEKKARKTRKTPYKWH